MALLPQLCYNKTVFTSNKIDKESEVFWQEYEEKTGEKILARGLGRYISGWEEFDRKGWTPLWGLIITSSGGFRFHHFPQKSWIDSFVSSGSKNEAREKTFFVPKEKIISAKLIHESKWWKKILIFTPARLELKFRNDAENELELLLELDFQKGDLSGPLCEGSDSRSE